MTPKIDKRMIKARWLLAIFYEGPEFCPENDEYQSFLDLIQTINLHAEPAITVETFENHKRHSIGANYGKPDCPNVVEKSREFMDVYRYFNRR